MSVLTKEQLNTILYFSSSCRAYADKGRHILDTIPPINKDAHFELENVFSQMISQLNKINEIILQQKCAGQSSSKFAMTGGFVGAATAGAAKGLLVGAPTCVMDAGLVAAIGAIIGALAGATIGTRSDFFRKEHPFAELGWCDKIFEKCGNLNGTSVLAGNNQMRTLNKW